MFGNLFEEEEEEVCTSTSSRGRVAKGGDEPPAPRGRSNLCGIKNQGGTCYLNSLLQTLLFTPEFRGKVSIILFDLDQIQVHQCNNQRAFMYLFHVLKHNMVYFCAEALFSLGPEELGCLEDREKPGAKVSSCTVGCSHRCSVCLCDM